MVVSLERTGADPGLVTPIASGDEDDAPGPIEERDSPPSLAVPMDPTGSKILRRIPGSRRGRDQ